MMFLQLGEFSAAHKKAAQYSARLGSLVAPLGNKKIAPSKLLEISKIIVLLLRVFQPQCELLTIHPHNVIHEKNKKIDRSK